MPRKRNPDGPGKGNRSANRYVPVQKRVVVDDDIAQAVRDYIPGIQIRQLVNNLLVEFLIKNGYPYERKTPETPTSSDMDEITA